MPNILTIALNPALDITTDVKRVTAGDKLRCSLPLVEPGGGGTNVSRAILEMGGDSLAFVAIAGFKGERLVSLLKQHSVTVEKFISEGETRQNLAVSDQSSGEQFRFVMPGPDWNNDVTSRALEAIRAVVPKNGYVVLSGSQPPGMALDFPSQLAAIVKHANARLIVDTSGAPLSALVFEGYERPHLLRLDQEESEMLAGKKLPDIEQLAGFAADLVARDAAEMVVLALGSKGSVLANGSGCWHSVSPPVEVISKVGAGDSFVGAFTLALSRGLPHEEALRWGVAAASSAVTTQGTNLCYRDQVEAIYEQCTLEKI